MKELTYTITEELGLHARPAGDFTKLAKTLSSTITVYKGEKSALATRILALMGLCIKQNDTIRVQVEGDTAEQDAVTIQAFLEENL